jgi:NADH-quinone oxidoreductase subunit N
MMVDAFTHRRQRNVTGTISILAIIAAGAASVWLWMKWPAASAFNGMILLDELRLSFTGVFLIVALLTILIATIWIDIEDLPAGEFHSLLLFATSGMMLMASAGDLVIVFLGLEILSIAHLRAGRFPTERHALERIIAEILHPRFIRVGVSALRHSAHLRRDRDGARSAGHHEHCPNRRSRESIAVSAAFVRGDGDASRRLQLQDRYRAVSCVGRPMSTKARRLRLRLSWLPVPRPPVVASFMRVFLFGFPIVTATATTAGYAHATWVGALAIMAALTMSIGNVVAIVQNNVKRMLAYSSIAHAGLCAGWICRCRCGDGRNAESSGG